MLLIWNIQTFDRTTKSRGHRLFHLRTTGLDPITQAEVEFVIENRAGKGRELLAYKHLFVEGEWEWNPEEDGGTEILCIEDYFEDESGSEITLDGIVQAITGSPTARAIPSGTKQHDIDFMLSERKPMPVAEVALTVDEIRILTYFDRDLGELENSTFLRSKVMLNTCGSKSELATSVSDEEIRSFVTIFRRLYMANEEANFKKAVAVFTNAVGNCPHGNWVAGVSGEYSDRLSSVPTMHPMVTPGSFTDPVKLLLDVFIYTQYAHQPSEKRRKEFLHCLSQVNGKHDVLTWMFLNALRDCSFDMLNAGRVVIGWFRRYCDHHGLSPTVLNSLASEHPAIGSIEKEEDRRRRLFEEKVEQAATRLWEDAGRPECGHYAFIDHAREKLSRIAPPPV